ncbi:hypothetical protein G9P44_004984 [Scheffersomyces stipitis]|nr:hypothetical protein G9P44_004984 [Scheffersomyces stipitis]
MINVDDYAIIKEGKAEILTPKEDKVFYNPIQQFNRDLSVMAINAYVQLRNEKFEAKQLQKLEKQKKTEETTETTNDVGATAENEFETQKVQTSDEINSSKEEQNSKRRKVDLRAPKINILEALSATGLRAIRYGHEIAQVNKIVANDLLAEAVKSIDRNIEYNKLNHVLHSNQGDAIKYMNSSGEKFHVIDLDPYGTATPFLDSAIQAIEEDGMLLVTCTDAGVLAGAGYPEKCFALYGGNNFGSAFINSEANHEAGIRLILQMIASTAAKYKKSIEPMLSLSIDFYFRLFIKVRTRPIEVKQLSSRTMITYGCNGCGHKVLQPLGRVKGNKFQYPKLETVSSECRYCSSYYTVAGPMFLPPLHNHEFIDRILKINSASDKNVYGTTERIKGMLTLAKNELDAPFYFNLSSLASIFKSNPIPIQEFARAIGNAGYKLSLTHAKKNSVKTDAPWETVLAIQRAWLIDSNKKYLEDNKDKPDLTDKQKDKVNHLQEDIAYNGNLGDHSTGRKLLEYFASAGSTTSSDEINFKDDNDQSEQLHKLRKVKMVRYQENPTKNWGPKARPSSK